MKEEVREAAYAKLNLTLSPHQALGMKTPYEMMTGRSDNPLLGYSLQQGNTDDDNTTK